MHDSSMSAEMTAEQSFDFFPPFLILQSISKHSHLHTPFHLVTEAKQSVFDWWLLFITAVFGKEGNICKEMIPGKQAQDIYTELR